MIVSQDSVLPRLRAFPIAFLSSGELRFSQVAIGGRLYLFRMACSRGESIELETSDALIKSESIMTVIFGYFNNQEKQLLLLELVLLLLVIIVVFLELYNFQSKDFY